MRVGLIFHFLFICTQAYAQTMTYEPQDKFPGGASTIADYSKNAFSHHAKNLDLKGQDDFLAGKVFFDVRWTPSPLAGSGRAGLGPTFNVTSCAFCHDLNSRGIGYTPEGFNIHMSLLFRFRQWNGNSFGPHQDYGDQLNPAGSGGVPGEGFASVNFKEKYYQYPDGTPFQLRHPTFRISKMPFGPLGDQTTVSARVTPHLAGVGLIDNISEADLLQNADEWDGNGDGISGRAHWVHDIAKNRRAVGRFGWKAEQPNLHQQNAAAFLGDIGITSPLFPEQNCPLVQVECAEIAKTRSGAKASVELNAEALEKVTNFTQLLAVSQRRFYSDGQVQKGKALFQQARCTSCHVESFTTAHDTPYAVLNGQRIFPYSDFLLHDMGPDLADQSLGAPELLDEFSREWRTPPLWGIGLIPLINGHSNLLHDGRARSIEEAILWHGGEAAPSRARFMDLHEDERAALIKFIESL